ncbi:MAG: hypothetical protein GW928_05560 [Rhodoferax sp.]|nr:hypothetical protein [Rhodoferax sp.]NCS62449.1 hypothetical protein [Rhodoferax sp.]OIP13693.1 MAG: hypothetical protein AUK50_13045 [Comamonadaceae bacterium CG2_30_57_122]PJC21149.1 MAG: hypothetical protein CO065_03990 [Comamonadaceae bacterium CG_4_9_14_0_8_um_filter_57_21]
MKTTLDLPDELVREAKLRALMQGRTLRDLVTQLLRQGLGLEAPKLASTLPPESMLGVGSNGLPVIHCRAGSAAEGLPVQDLLQLEQQTQTQEDLRRAGLSV